MPLKKDEVWNSITHSFSLGYSSFSFIYFDSFSIKLLSLFLIIVFTLSTLYHSETNLERKRFFRILDMSSIHLLIPATAAAYSIQSGYNHYYLFVILALIFSSYVLLFNNTPLLADTMVKSCVLSGSISSTLFLLSFPSLNLLLNFFLGALIYICGIYFYIKDDDRKFFHTIWHAFVIVGSITHINGLT